MGFGDQVEASAFREVVSAAFRQRSAAMRDTVMRCAAAAGILFVWLTGLIIGLALRLYYRGKKR